MASMEDLRYQPLYTFADVDRLAQVSHGTARRWLEGYTARRADGSAVRHPPVGRVSTAQDGVSFVDLIEVVAIGRLKARGFGLRTIRRIVENCQTVLGIERPLVSLRFKTGGRDIFVDLGERLVEVGRHRGLQAWAEILAPFLEDLDYAADDIVTAWWPVGRDQRVQIHPAYGFGRPVVAGTGVPTEVIRELFEAKESMERIAQELNLTPRDVESALRYELRHAA
jgi:uncharacterized protein (DUF433 family)